MQNYIGLAIITLVAHICAAGSWPNYQQSSDLVESSKRAIIATGFSETYFDEHFRLASTSVKPADIRVVWILSVNEYEVSVIDSIGYYSEDQKRQYVHSIRNTLGSTRDISKTIPRPKAAALMRSCLGKYAGEAVVLMRLSSSEQASLYLTAHSARATVKTRSKETPDQEPDKKGGYQDAKNDQPEREPKIKGPQIYLGYINLESGKCTKGQAAVMP